jgi:putative flippase GtrA
VISRLAGLYAAFGKQFFVFVLMGLVTTAVHTSVAVLAHHVGRLPPLAANFTGYAVAVGVSYLANARLTFRQDLGRGQFLRFVTLSLTGLAVSQGIIWLLTHVFDLRFELALAVAVLAVPPLTFLGARLWVFRAPKPDGRPLSQSKKPCLAIQTRPS